MRFGVPRSVSPSPVRGRPRHGSTFGLQSYSENGSDSYDSDTDYSDTGSDAPDSSASSSSSSSSNSFYNSSSLEIAFSTPEPKHTARSIGEQRYIEETIAAIRLRTRHHDPYEEWEKQTRKDAFHSARKELTAMQSQLHDEQYRVRTRDTQHLAALHAQQMSEVENQLRALKVQQQNEEKKTREIWKEHDRKVWERIETVIKDEEDKVNARVEAERRLKEEKERKRKEEELERQLAEEKRKQEEEIERKRQEQAQRQREEQEKEREAEKSRQLEEERTQARRLQAEAEQRKGIGMTTPNDEWRQARANLQRLKDEATKLVKSNKDMKTEWGKLRRQITPKIGQLTNDQEAISRISTQLIHIINPPNTPPHPPAIHAALLSSLAKAILLQAETEVTAEKRSAEPLAQAAFNLLDALDGFPEIFFAKLVQRVGGWPVPIVVPPTEHDGRAWRDEAERAKAMGYRKGANGDGEEEVESAAEYMTRVAGVMRVYFHILKIPAVRQPMKPMFQLPRCWVWVARLVGDRSLLETDVGAQLLYTALDVLGSRAEEVWGRQWIKMLCLVYEGVTVGFGGGDKFIGGNSIEGKAARVRVQLEVERIVAG